MAGVGRGVSVCFPSSTVPGKGIWDSKKPFKEVALRSMCVVIGGAGVVTEVLKA